MDTSTIVAIVGGVFAIIVSSGSIITFWLKFSQRISDADATAEAAKTAAGNANVALAAVHIEVDRLKDELVEHRVAVAREYVSKDTLSTLESRVIEAINTLGQRLDNLFKQGR